MKFCVDCKHCRIVQINRDEEVYNCINPKLGRDIVTGKTIPRRCRDVRVGSTNCGMSAKWFEPKLNNAWWFASNKKALKE